MELNQESLLSVPIRDDEIVELLERLAATEEMFKTPVSTIRDVAELTDASPNLIARLLSEMRGPGELEKIIGRLDAHEERLRKVEQREVSKAVATAKNYVRAPRQTPIPTKPPATDEDWERYRILISEDQKLDPYAEERQSRETTMTVGVVIIAIIIFAYAVFVVLDPSPSRRPSLPNPYEVPN